MERMDFIRKVYNFLYKNVVSVVFILLTILILIFFKSIPGTIHRFNKAVKQQKQAVKTIDSLSKKTITPYHYNQKK